MSKKESQELNQIIWAIHKTHPDLVDTMREKLSEVVDPEIGLSIIALGLVRNVEIEDETARIKMILTTPFCPYGPALIEMTKQKATEATNKPVTVELGIEPWDFSMMEDPSSLDWGMYT